MMQTTLPLSDAPSAHPYAQLMEAYASYVASERPRLEAPANVADLMRPVLSGRHQEEFHALLLDTKHTLLRDECITVGLLDRSHVHAREVFHAAIRESCARLILVHNHPSGDPTPSQQDIASTNKLVEAGKIVGIEVLDHVIIGQRVEGREHVPDWRSMREAYDVAKW